MEVANIPLDKKTLKQAQKDAVGSARAVNLTYVSDSSPGITRVKEGDSFAYYNGDKKITDTEELIRIKKLAIPPAWENVWICKKENGHLQATGSDKLGRKQYRYHTLWSAIRNHTKFYHLLDFGKQLPAIRTILQKHLALTGYPREKVLAIVVSLLERTNIRIGSSAYEKLYGSFGLTTMKNKHVDISGTSLRFSFKGKKGIQHRITIRSRKLSRLVQGCKDIPGKELFEYIDSEGAVHNVDSGMVNEYIHEISGGDFTAKDFRTWTGSVQALLAFKDVGDYETESDMKKNIVTVYDRVAAELGNTRAVCKKYYVHPILEQLYEQKKLSKYLSDLEETTTPSETTSGLSAEEKVLMKILEQN